VPQKEGHVLFDGCAVEAVFAELDDAFDTELVQFLFQDFVFFMSSL